MNAKISLFFVFEENIKSFPVIKINCLFGKVEETFSWGEKKIFYIELGWLGGPGESLLEDY